MSSTVTNSDYIIAIVILTIVAAALLVALVWVGILLYKSKYTLNQSNLPKPVKSLVLNKFSGVWYEVGKYGIGDSNCIGNTITQNFSQNGDDMNDFHLNIEETCVTKYNHEKRSNVELYPNRLSFVDKVGDQTIIQPAAFRAKGAFNYKNYEIIDVDTNQTSNQYNYAVVASGDDSITILSRQHNIDDGLYQTIINNLRAKDVKNVDKIVRLDKPYHVTKNEQ